MAAKQRARLVRMYGGEGGEKLWHEVLSSSRWPFYVFASETDARELSNLRPEPIGLSATTESGYCLFRL